MTDINIRYVARLLGFLIIMLSLSMSLSFAWEIWEHYYVAHGRETREVLRALGFAMLIGLLIGGCLSLVGRKARTYLGRREALLLVACTWFVGAAVAALPYFIWGQIHDFSGTLQDQAFRLWINCFFEAMSGLTTTGSTVLGQIETIPRGLLLWRAFTQWLGGLGIVVLFVALLPGIGGGSKRLFGAEMTGIGHEDFTPHIRETSRMLILIYLGFTLAQILLMKLVDFELSWFDAVTHTFATLATGGFSTLNASAGGLNAGIQWVMIVFMLLAGVNFALYQQVLLGRTKRLLRNSELQFYLLLIGVGFLIVLFSIYGTNYDVSDGRAAASTPAQYIRDALFQVVSIITSSGFVTTNFEQWDLISKSVLIFLMFVGACGGSTSGGIKVIRILTTLKVMWVELERAYRPNVVRTVKVGNITVSADQRVAVLAYVLGIFVITAIGTLILLVTDRGVSGTTALTAAISAVNNIGPGFDAIGAIDNYGWFSPLGKGVLCVLMAIGRLEVFAVAALFMPGFWRSN